MRRIGASSALWNSGEQREEQHYPHRAAELLTCLSLTRAAATAAAAAPALANTAANRLAAKEPRNSRPVQVTARPHPPPLCHLQGKQHNQSELGDTQKERPGPLTCFRIALVIIMIIKM